MCQFLRSAVEREKAVRVRWTLCPSCACGLYLLLVVAVCRRYLWHHHGGECLGDGAALTRASSRRRSGGTGKESSARAPARGQTRPNRWTLRSSSLVGARSHARSRCRSPDDDRKTRERYDFFEFNISGKVELSAENLIKIMKMELPLTGRGEPHNILGKRPVRM